MSEPLFATGAGVALLLLSLPLALRARHPRSRPLAAYLVFVGVFALVAAASYAVLVALSLLLGLVPLLETLPGALVFIALVLAPGWMAARAWVRRPPRVEAPPPDVA